MMQVMGTNGEKPREGMIWVDRPPEKRKRRKADHAAVEAYMKKREEEKTRAEGSTGDDAEGGGNSGQEGEMSVDAVSVTTSAPAAPEQDAPSHAPMEVEPNGAPESSVHELSAPVVEKPRSCGNKMCGRTMTTSETGTICHRCKERMKKRAMKVKRRFKLVMPTSSKVLVKSVTQPVVSVEDEEGDDGMEEVMVEEVLAQPTPPT
ncbi:hypothetical protein PHLGIDRAFT_28299 [Phlebiopsis gigantea 11061_1 CR5-6]|uniref:Uncharacterized protein n=1 Tax=Phlebiopsis gigantea (strain 11061_1 CR5-6) TaxID=745531 RepID=A0A0C3SES4_PHLG1|nr:hypothetical protein PHLGIDRAFT_28299 [Phlebiopsis gigantea 11061_1 CR5-6]